MKNFAKCMKCPYKLGEVKCKTSPCPECIASGKKKPPFPEPIKKVKRNYKGDS